MRHGRVVQKKIEEREANRGRGKGRTAGTCKEQRANTVHACRREGKRHRPGKKMFVRHGREVYDGYGRGGEKRKI